MQYDKFYLIVSSYNFSSNFSKNTKPSKEEFPMITNHIHQTKSYYQSTKILEFYFQVFKP